ncbi:MAG: hypothetical protein JSU65_10130 [Candidatus Zixiibacteriota bacterium]|nr:MAG: hypothetical protein JSU65_10130 [candidate division Zixibacteria bacterium]
MKNHRHTLGITVLALSAVLVVGSVQALPPWALNPRLSTNQGTGPELSPSPNTIDQITHDHGNIVTTVDNWGYIGGYQWYGEPSAEWPRNSDHDYIGELKYWMGAVSGPDTLVANSYDDFQGMPSLISSVLTQKILLSTDTTRYYDYNPADTTGLGNGNPANGWRIWNADSADWVYTVNYNPRDSVFYPGGPISVQESHFRFNDAAQGTSLMGLELTHTILQWNYCYNEDFMFVIIEITNTSATDYSDFAFGLYVDLDVGGPDGTGENGRLGDLVAYDSAANLAWTYDEDGYDEGWQSATGIMGTKYLETPDGIGMTGFRTGLWAQVPSDDVGMFEFIDSAGFDPGLPPDDQYYIQCTRGIDLLAGKTVRVVYALVAGSDSLDFRNNADLAQQLYDNYFVGPQPPTTPTLSAAPGDGKVYLYWNDVAESAIDPLSGETDFAGYKLYRSGDQGFTWGAVDYTNTNTCLGVDYCRLAEFYVNAPGDPIPRSFVDTGVYNDFEYWYALVAIDSGASATGVEPLQSGFGTAGSVVNVVSVIPRTEPLGYYDAAGTVQHIYNGTASPSAGTVVPTVFDDNSVASGTTYRVVFEDRPERTFWHLLNETTGDTLLLDQLRESGDPGLYEVVEGIRVVVTNPDRDPILMEQTALGGTEATIAIAEGWFLGTMTGYFDDTLVSDANYRCTYELRFTGNVTNASAINDTAGLGMAWNLPFEVWNATTNERVAAVVYDFGLDGAWDSWDLVTIVNYPYDPVTDPFTYYPEYFSWFFGFDYVLWNPVDGDVFTIQGPALNSPDDEFTFTSDGINAASATANMGSIRVVPNPYLAHKEQAPDTTLVGSFAHHISFENIPADCKIRIYTLTGDLVTTLEPDNTGAVNWDLRSSENRQVASGIYIYHVESPYGEHVGRFAVIL